MKDNYVRLADIKKELNDLIESAFEAGKCEGYKNGYDDGWLDHENQSGVKV